MHTFGCSVPYHVGKRRWSQIFGERWGSGFGIWAWLAPWNTPLPHMCYHAEFGRPWLNDTSVFEDPPKKLGLSRPAFRGHSRSSELTGSIGYLWLPISELFSTPRTRLRFAVLLIYCSADLLTKLSPSQRRLPGTHCQLSFVIVVRMQHSRNISRLSCFM